MSNKEQLLKDGAVFREADPETGRVLEKGMINRTARKMWNIGESFFDKQVFHDTGNSTTNKTTNSSGSGKQTNPKENLHNESPLNNVDNSINDGAKNVNLT